MNNKRKTNNIYTRLATVLLMVAGLLMVENVWADGSRDLYPAGVKGGRAYLRASTTESAAFPFANLGTHYVYAEAGERIAIASSAQNSTTKRLFLYNPNGTDVTPTGASAPNETRGNIPSRTAELSGPRLPEVTTGNEYTPIYYTVPVGGEGIYKIEFRGTSTTTTGDTRMNYVVANSNWTQAASSNYLSAWDISVAKQSGSSWSWQTGRVYTNVLNMDNPSYGGSSGSDNNNFRPSSGFYGNFKVLTRDGYVYNVGNNGSQGISFTFMVNNRGFHEVGNKNIASYKSIDASSASTVQNRYHDPRSADAEAAVTHKIFYNIPDQSMPKEAKGGPVNGNFTWLHPEQQNLEVADMQVEGVDATVAQISNKGGYVIFENNSGGDYTITISPNISDPNYVATMDFETRVLQGQSYPGVNRIYFDGKDGVGDYLPQGNIPVEITIQLQGAEVHFPYIDMELNHFGIVIELLEGPNYLTSLSDKVYWDDSGIGNGGGSNGSKSNPINASHTTIPLGTSSNTNGHIWGTGSNATASTFGDNMGMDTWTFIKGESYTQAFAVVNKVANLSIESIEVDKTEGVYVGDTLTYTVVVANKKGSCPVEGAAFSFILPEGFEGLYDEADITFTSSSSCGSESVAVTYDSTTRTFNSKLNLGGSCDATGGDCTITYTFKARVTESSDPANTNATATIMRPKDVTDPDATNTSDVENPIAPEGIIDIDNYYYPPTDPFFEVEHNGKEGVSNNIKGILVGLQRVSDLGIVKSVDNPSPDIGETVTFTLKVTNHGPHRAVNIVVTDIVPDGYTDIDNIDNEGVLDGNIITWNITELENAGSTTLSFKAKVVNDGDYTNTAKVTGDGEDTNPANNVSSATVVPCVELNIFKEDFGTSNLGVDLGRTTSPYMPSGSFTFGIPFPQSNVSNETAIDNDHYAVVAPGYIKAGWKIEDLGWYFWTPLHNEANTVTDRSGTVDGAVMVINAGNTLQPFYERPQLLQVGATYRASFWLYLMKGPSQVAIDVKHAKTGEVLATITSPMLEDWNTDVKSKWSYIDLYFTVPVPDDKEDCEVDNVILSFRNNNAATFGNDYYVDDISLDKVCSPPPGTIIINCPDPDYMKNYWHGTIDNDWNKTGNWTANFVPVVGEDIVFATDANNGASGNGNGEGPAVNDLYLDNIDQNDSGGRIIGDLINDSEVDLIITTGNQLIINGEVIDNTPDEGTIVVKASPDMPSGTLKFTDPTKNQNVGAVVEFYSKAYECKDCGFYRNSWQYFGVPVQSAAFPYGDVTGTETVNRWDETYNGDKWRPTTGALSAFVGYQITNNVTTLPTGVYNFNGKLTVGDATVALTKTASVNYSGTNLVGNSYTAAIPISTDAMTFPTGAEQTVYLFNTGTRDQWRKLNGQAINQDGYRSGQYLAVPLNLGGTSEFPDRIPSTHSFMILTEGSGDLHINYMNLTKNTKVNRGDGTEIVTRSVDNNSAFVIGAQNNNSQLPSLVMDVIGEESADRVWIFQKEGTSHNFNNGWDGRKMLEDDIAQLYVSALDDSKLQVATVPQLDSLSLGFIADIDGKYTFEFAQMGQLKGTDIYLHDAVTGITQQVGDEQSYSFTAKRGEAANRFSLSSKENSAFLSTDEALLEVAVTNDGEILIVNSSSRTVSAFVYDSNGVFLQQLEVNANDKTIIDSVEKGTYMVRLQNSHVNDVRRVTVE